MPQPIPSGKTRAGSLTPSQHHNIISRKSLHKNDAKISTPSPRFIKPSKGVPDHKGVKTE